MSCDNYERMISKMVDGEVQPDESAGVFAHLSGCAACRSFYRDVQRVGSSLDRLVDSVPEATIHELRVPSLQPLMRPQTFWDRRIPVRLPLLALLVCAILASMFMSFTTETVYVTRLPATVITAQVAQSHSGQ